MAKSRYFILLITLLVLFAVFMAPQLCATFLFWSLIFAGSGYLFRMQQGLWRRAGGWGRLYRFASAGVVLWVIGTVFLTGSPSVPSGGITPGIARSEEADPEGTSERAETAVTAGAEEKARPATGKEENATVENAQQTSAEKAPNEGSEGSGMRRTTHTPL
ncbi:MAG: hypothetical protein D6795_18445, partial [Deltaproteobacteria bacterium]